MYHLPPHIYCVTSFKVKLYCVLVRAGGWTFLQLIFSSANNTPASNSPQNHQHEWPHHAESHAAFLISQACSVNDVHGKYPILCTFLSACSVLPCDAHAPLHDHPFFAETSPATMVTTAAALFRPYYPHNDLRPSYMTMEYHNAFIVV